MGKAKRSRGPIRFEAVVRAVRGQTLLRLPKPASEELPSRGQVSVEGTFGGRPLQTVLEPDGELGHWMRVEPRLREAADVAVGDAVTVEVKTTEEWPEPTVPEDLRAALGDAPDEVRDLWEAITPMARWEWVRWIGATKSASTRARRVDVSISKLSDGKRRPCCFNLASCTDPELSKSGKLFLE